MLPTRATRLVVVNCRGMACRCKAGAALSQVIPSRWAFEAVGHDLGARRILARGGSRLGPPLLASYGDAGTQSTGTYWLILGAFAVVFLVATWGVLVRSTRKR